MLSNLKHVGLIVSIAPLMSLKELTHSLSSRVYIGFTVIRPYFLEKYLEMGLTETKLDIFCSTT